MRFWKAVLVATLLPAAAVGQPAEPARVRPPIQLGFGIAHISMSDLDISLGGIRAAPELRVMSPWSPRFAFEGVVMVTQTRRASLYYDRNGQQLVRCRIAGGPSGSQNG